MPTFFDTLFGSGSQPVRRELNFRITFDKNGKPVVIPVNGGHHSVSQEGSTDSAGLIVDSFYSCGHPMTFPVGGQCIECQALSCLQCFWTCSACHCPICKKHGFVTTSDQGQKITLCASCLGILKRRRWMKRLLSPFVRFDNTASHRPEGGN